MSDPIKRDDAPEPCPFCKCEKVTTSFDHEQGLKWGYASCDGCAARGPDVRTNWDREPDAPWHSEAIAAWNTRALPAIDPAATREAALVSAVAKQIGEEHGWVRQERLDEAEDKLTKAVAFIRRHIPDSVYEQRQRANAFLAELEKTK